MNILLMFSSVTAAKRIEKTIAKYGVLSTVVHTPKSISKSGCSHSVRISERNLTLVLKLLENSDVRPLGVFKEYNVSEKCVYKELVL